MMLEDTAIRTAELNRHEHRIRCDQLCIHDSAGRQARQAIGSTPALPECEGIVAIPIGIPCPQLIIATTIGSGGLAIVP